MINQPMMSNHPHYNSLSEGQRYGIQDALNAVIRLQANYKMDIESLFNELTEELKLEVADYDFSFMARKLVAYCKDLKKIDDHLLKIAKGESKDGE